MQSKWGKGVKSKHADRTDRMMAFYLFGALCVLYFVILSVFTGFSNVFHFFWLLLGILFFACGIWEFYRSIHSIELPRMLHHIIRVFCILLALLFVYGESLVISGFLEKGEPDLQYIVVLGAKVNGETPSRSLNYRIESAYEYLKENPETIAVLSGGQGRDEGISEAECMYRELSKRGIEQKRLIREDQSTNTKENLTFSLKLMSSENPTVGIVTNNFHVYRSVLTARKLGITQACGISAKTTFWILPDQMIRELFSLVKFYIYGAS